MTTVLEERLDERRVEGRKPKYSVYDWYLNLKTHEFECDDEAKCLLVGEPSSSLTAKALFDLLPKSQRKVVKNAFQAALDSGERTYTHCCLLNSVSLFVYVEIVIERVSAFELKGTISPCLNIASRHEAAEVFYSVFENPHHGIIVTDSETRILACNHHFENLTGYLRNELVGLKTQIFNADKHSQAYYQQLWQRLSNFGYWNGTILSRRSDGSVFPQDLTIHKVNPGNGSNYYVGFSSDLSGALDRIEDIESGGIDLLTQLPSKETFITHLAEVCRYTEIGQGVVVLAMQPNFPKGSIQEVKRQFASYLKDNTKVLCSGYIGHDCFVVTLAYSFQQATQVVTNIGRSITKLFHSFKHAQAPVATALKEGISGVSVLDVDATNPNQLVSHAYQALLELHSGQSRRINFYDRQIHNQIERKKALEEYVVESLESGAIDVYFQPIVDLQKNRIDKFEALCRFPAREGLAATTQELVGVVEELDRVVQLDDLVLLSALEQLAELQRLFGDHVKLSVNRSLKTSTELDQILQRAAMVLDKEGVSPESITLEFTESAYFESDKKNKQVLSLLREAGVKIAVDDFGTGSASFRYLKECYFDILKIDRAFIQNITFESRQYFIVQALILLAKRLDLEVIAEGVETEQELHILASLGVDYIQGYYFSKPMPLKELKQVTDYCQLRTTISQVKADSMVHLVEHSHHVDAGEPLSLVYQYFADGFNDYLPVVEEKVCVGYIDRANMNLHLTPNMGTDLESNKENAYWHKPANRLMLPVKTKVAWDTPQSEIPRLVAQATPFPWILVDEQGLFKGIVSSKSVMEYLANNNSVT
ncbi:EAL domain-containing protein [Vibrio europaeus]|uniref:EAL domain-containing protein n=1 Tax=Vibrio europaeus TaxID=300876 RepID=A0AAE7AU14_9VIBR|nr:EAL domain-containing protein [Vibrio europaeus]MDC5807079.1 EAL domain-containing protein [Vibrio europaeus]MDC5809674.1 EAL domain-containing protein [Vibrio europaeus]MDC5821430.1 EAL domain-containing protein [Vibrio europaeus]MDC5827604.1 EAL domain-containing protein [Vibrio europaeus]MDC5830448.1 EAL domain-containing protein [Vibrio europaeus]